MRYGLLAGLLFAIDFVLKRKADGLPRIGRWGTYWKGRVAIWNYHNYGAFYNLGQGKAVLVRIASVSLTGVAAVYFLLSLTTRGNALLRAGLSILLGGAFSNTYDRLKKKYVVDYIQFPKVPVLKKVIFNLSDFCILIGAMLTAFNAQGSSAHEELSLRGE